jgi:hypothetical protein
VVLTSAATLCGQTVSVVQTNPDQSALLSPQPALNFVPGTGSQLAINVDDTIRYQRLEGVGASFTDSGAYLVWNKLTPAQRSDLMQTLFGANGIHLSFLRQPIGATDLALSNYTYDDLSAGDTDPQMTQFSIDHDKAYINPGPAGGTGSESADQSACPSLVAAGMDEEQRFHQWRLIEHRRLRCAREILREIRAGVRGQWHSRQLPRSAERAAL